MVIKDCLNLDRAAVERLRREARLSRTQDQAEVQRLQRRYQWRERMLTVIHRLDAAAPAAALRPEVERLRGFVAQFHRAFADEDDELMERAVRDVEAAWTVLLGSLPELEQEAPAPADVPPAGPVPPDDMVTCANCSARLPKGFAFCGQCGMALKKDACSACGAALVEGFQFCGKCGARLE